MNKLPPFPNYELIDQLDNYKKIAQVIDSTGDQMKFDNEQDGVPLEGAFHKHLREAFVRIDLWQTTSFADCFQTLTTFRFIPERGYWLGAIHRTDRHLLAVLNDAKILELLDLLITLSLKEDWDRGGNGTLASWDSAPSHNELGDVLENLKVSTALSLEELDVVGKLFPERAEAIRR